MQSSNSYRNYAGSQLVIQKIDSNRVHQSVENQTYSTYQLKINKPNKPISPKLITSKFTKQIDKVNVLQAYIPNVEVKKIEKEPKSWLYYCGASIILYVLSILVQIISFSTFALVIGLLLSLASTAFCIVGIVHLSKVNKNPNKKKEIERDKKREDIDIY
ncbi:MAG: hypothetical protein SGJ04_03615 [Bacteroidota bacterium]|nr:hypothetical protein [Bacteroidota bacterium]